MSKTTVILITRLALFIVYFWFGLLKLFNLSPANPLVSALLVKTLPFISPETFFIILGAFELMIAALALSGKYLKLLAVCIGVHLFTTFMPLLLLPQITWQGLFIPTIEGQYILKNILIVSALINLLYLSKENS